MSWENDVLKRARVAPMIQTVYYTVLPTLSK